ncbi:hypothetical protein LAZ67_5004285, partial [Cordylochernes scorpioides]
MEDLGTVLRRHDQASKDELTRAPADGEVTVYFQSGGGSDYFGQLLTGKVVHLGEDLTAVETKLGWTLMGQSPVVGENGYEYSTILQEWEREGLIERIEENRPQKKGHYLPHRPVFKAESRTTPLRPVLDASCRSYNGLSLNDYLEKGPNLLEKIPEIVIRFREKGIGVLADIRKAFQMITVQLQDQDFLRFLWWDQTDPMKLTVFRHKRVVFGLNCSPFILGAVIDHHLNSVQGPAAEIAKTMARSFYMDNLVTSLSSQEEVQQFQNTAVNIMEMAKNGL